MGLLKAICSYCLIIVLKYTISPNGSSTEDIHL